MAEKQSKAIEALREYEPQYMSQKEWAICLNRLEAAEPDWERLVEPWPDDAVVVTVKAIYRNENGGQVSTRCFADFRHPVPALKVGDRVKAWNTVKEVYMVGWLKIVDPDAGIPYALGALGDGSTWWFKHAELLKEDDS